MDPYDAHFLPVIRAWTAKRAGAAMTIKGTLNGEHTVIPNIVLIEASSVGCIANHRDGRRWSLLPENALS